MNPYRAGALGLVTTKIEKYKMNPVGVQEVRTCTRNFDLKNPSTSARLEPANIGSNGEYVIVRAPIV